MDNGPSSVPADGSRSSSNAAEKPPETAPPITPKTNTTSPSALFGEHATREQTPRNSKTLITSDLPAVEAVPAMRRIIAEDPNYNRPKVAPLSELCLKHCTENFAYNSNVIHYLNERQKRILLDALEPDLPLKVTAHVIGEDPYWARCCHDRWSVVDLTRHGGSWKRAFFERILEETVENFIPGHTYSPRLTECVVYAAPYVKCLDIGQLLPPLKQQSKDKTSDEDSEDSDSDQDFEEQSVDHLDLGPVLSKLPHLEELSVSYIVKNCGMNFDWSVFQFTAHDCLNLSKAVQMLNGLKVLRLTRSRVDSERCRVLCNHLLNHPSIECLDLSHNLVGDRGARALSKLIGTRSNLTTLNLADNRLQASGALALAHALAKQSCPLVRLNLRLNRIRDDGGVAIAKSLLRNTSLKELNLAANDLSETAAGYFAHVVAHNQTLTHLDLSNNQIGPDSSRKLLDGMRCNLTLHYLDLRFTGCCQEAEYEISQLIVRNQDRTRQLALSFHREENGDEVSDARSGANLSVGVTSVGNRHRSRTMTHDFISVQ